MVKENIIPIENKKPVEEVRQIEEEIRLPKLSEITDKDGKVKLPPELIEKLRDPNARFRVDVVAFPVDSQALMIAGSQSIMSKIRSDFPNVAELLEEMPDATLGFLREKHAFSAYRGQNAFKVPCSHTDNYSKTGPAAWSEYHTRIRQYVSEICQRTPEMHNHYEKLRQAREDLAKYIWDEYYRVLPFWPNVGGVNSRSFEADTKGAYENSSNHIVWSCLGWINVEDRRPAYDTFMASFSGSPEIKLLILDLYQMRRIENGARSSSANFENLKREIRSNSSYYGGLIDWQNF